MDKIKDLKVWEVLKNFFKKIWTYDIIHPVCYSIIVTMIIECLNKRNLSGIWMPFTSPVIFLVNMLIIASCLSIGMMFKKRAFVYTLISVGWLGLAVTNFIVKSTRKTPFTAMDFLLIDDAIKVAPMYLTLINIVFIIVLIVAVIALLIILFRKTGKVETELSRRRFFLFGFFQSALVILFTYAAIATFLLHNVMGTDFGNLSNAFQNYGFTYCFTTSVLNRGVSKDSDYSEEYVENLKETIDSTTTDEKTAQETPNIIFLQLESFFDPTEINGLEVSEQVLPNFNRLQSEFTSGYLSVPVFGAGTVNTEFEVQTGMNLDDFGPGEYPYKTVLQNKVCESAAYALKNLGYTTHVVHNNDATFYTRNKVFTHLGYDTFTPIEYMDGIELTPNGNWAKDEILTEYLEKALNSTDGSDYIYTISVEGHGDYPNEYPEGYTPEITISNFPDSANQTGFEYYVNMIHDMDKFIGELTDMLSQRDEKTVLVMYGDHLPTFNLTDSDMKHNSIYETEYVMWSNFDTEKEDVDLEAYQLTAYVFERLGISEGNIFKYHQTSHDSEDYLKNLTILEYDILYGDQDIYEGESPYTATNLHYGLDTISITGTYEYDGDLYVEGTYFNDYSTVFINNKKYTTEKINDRLLKVENASVNEGDIVSVAQIDSDGTELSRVMYTVPASTNEDALDERFLRLAA
ncbi:LTA synthase family protein [Lachnospira sp.]|jgi:phosphoglycerol transferase MdoB-like AlkP superfamily enzyme|uniref:LTA synthase family protein n=1 Tax=Lachnospira sp. TaxID=2049031 RepID=UPI00257CDD1A|nr:alkaline phosphatase family protein [Lachnospira sp.]